MWKTLQCVVVLIAVSTATVASPVTQARSERLKGNYAQALKTLRAGEKEGSTQWAWHVAMSETLEKVGQYHDALDHAKQALTLAPLQPQPVLLQGRLLETLNRRTEAKTAYDAVKHIIDQNAHQKTAAALVATGQILDRHASLSKKRASDQARNILHNYLQRAYQELDEKYWPAHLAAAEFLLAKHKPNAAMTEYALLAKKNSKVAGMYTGQAAVALSRWQFENAITLAGKALTINPNDADALCVKAACYLQWRKFALAPPLLEKVLKVNPNHVQALSLLAATYVRMGQDDKAKTMIARAEAVAPRTPIVPLTIGQWLVSGRQFDQAETYLLDAVARSPDQPDALAELGKMYMQTGQETKALKLLEQAHKLDDFRQDVVHYLNVALQLATFLVRETDHFIIKVHPRDEVMLDPVAEFMEQIYPELTGDYGFEPKQKTIIEIMPTQKAFSARIAGRSWIPTVGACTGRVIALAAPRRKAAMGLHNWAEVLRHEYAHTITLTQTGNRIPHWFTEALAVWQQKDKRSQNYVRALSNATRSNRLLPIKEIDWGFQRPKRRGDRMLAYCQSEWMMEYIIRTQGFGKIREMLQGFQDGKTQMEVFASVLGCSEKQFDAKFRTWAKKQVAGWGHVAQKRTPLKKAERNVKLNPEDATAQADYARSLYLAKKLPQAQAAGTKALALDAKNVLAVRILANVFLKRKEYDQAIAMCKRLESIDPSSSTGPRVLAQCYIATHRAPEAIAAFEVLQQRTPLDTYPYTMLAKLYIQQGQSVQAIPHLRHLHRHSMNNPTFARQAAEIYRAEKQYAQAIEMFTEVLRINPYDAAAHQAIATLALRTKHYPRALSSAHALTQINPKNAEHWAYLAVMQYRIGKATKNTTLLKAAQLSAEQCESAGGTPSLPQIKQLLKSAL